MAVSRERVRDSARGAVNAHVGTAGAFALTSDEFDLFEGGDKVNSTLCVAPDLIAYVARESEKEANVSKAARKAREEKLMANSGMSVDEVVAAALGQASASNSSGLPKVGADGLTKAQRKKLADAKKTGTGGGPAGG